MQYADPNTTWDDWDDTHGEADEPTRLAALREYIAAVARRWVHSCTYDAAWANKKLAKLGITDRIQVDNSYILEVPVSGVTSYSVYASNRVEAEERFRELAASGRSFTLANPTLLGDPVFTSGPEDPDGTPDPDAPTTVDATLFMLREIILLGHIAGPKICEEEANRVLGDFGLAPIPPRQSFEVVRSISGAMRTVVTAYDEASAQRVAMWRWDNDRAGYEVTQVTPAGDLEVAPN